MIDRKLSACTICNGTYQQAYGDNYSTAHTNGLVYLLMLALKYFSTLKKQQSEDLYVTANDIFKDYL